MMIKLFAEAVRAIAGYLRGQFMTGRQFLHQEVNGIMVLFGLLLRPLRCNSRWTLQEIREMKIHFWNASKMVCGIAIFLLPGGLLLLSLAAGALHRKH